MAGEIREFSIEEISSVIPSFQQPGVVSDIQGQPLGNIPEDKKKIAKTVANVPLNTLQLPTGNVNSPANATSNQLQLPDVKAVTDAVTQANQNIQTNLPAPTPGSSVQILGNEVKQAGSSLADTLMNNWQIPVGLAAAYGVYKLLGEGGGNPPDGSPPSPPPPKKSMRDRMLLGEVKEPTMDPFEMTPATKPAAPVAEAPPKPMLSQQDMDLIRQSEANKAAKEAEALAKAPIQPPAVAPEVAPVAPPPAPVQPTVTQAVATGQSVTPAIEAEVAKEIDTPKTEEQKPAGKKRGRKSAEEKAAIAAAIPPSEVGLTKQQLGMKKYLESFYGGGDVGAKTYESIKDILGYTPAFPEGKGGGLNVEETAKVKGYRKENIPGPKVNLTHEMKKAMKAGGGAAVLAAIPGFAEAKNAREFFGNVAEALLPIGVTPSELASGTLPPEKVAALQAFMKERQKLGSPYRSVPPPGP